MPEEKQNWIQEKIVVYNHKALNLQPQLPKALSNIPGFSDILSRVVYIFHLGNSFEPSRQLGRRILISGFGLFLRILLKPDGEVYIKRTVLVGVVRVKKIYLAVRSKPFIHIFLFWSTVLFGPTGHRLSWAYLAQPKQSSISLSIRVQVLIAIFSRKRSYNALQIK